MIYIIAQTSLWILIPLIISVAMTASYNYYNVKFHYVEDKGWVEWERKDNYLKKLSTDFSFAKEIRLFGLRDKFQTRMEENAKLKAELLKRNRNKRIPSFVVHQAADFIFELSIYLYLGYSVLVPNTITLGSFSMYAAALRKIKSTLRIWSVNLLYLH